jgi:hypothetical protein
MQQTPIKRHAPSSTLIEPQTNKIKSPSASSQNTYVRPEFSDSKLNYSSNDNSPYLVNISRSEPDPASGLSIRLLLFAQLIHKQSVTGIVKDGIKASRRNRVTVEFKSFESANKFIGHAPKIQLFSFHPKIPYHS